MRITIVLAILALSYSLLIPCNLVYAQNASSSGSINLDSLGSLDQAGAVEIGQSKIAPNSPFYFLKAIREKIENILASTSQSKVSLKLELAQRRLRESKTLLSAQKQDLLPPTLERYKLHLDEARNLSSSNSGLKMSVGEAISRHLDVLQRMYDSVGNPRAKQAIRSAIEKAQDENQQILDSLDLTSQQQLIRKIALRQALACQFLQRESSSSALNGTEQQFLAHKVETCKEKINTVLKDELMDIIQKRSSEMKQ